MKKILLFATMLSIGSVIAQSTDATYIFYHQHANLVNPAVVGLEMGHTVSVDIRNQFRDMIEAPLTQTFFTTHKLSQRVGLGVSIANNKVFIQKQHDSNNYGIMLFSYYICFSYQRSYKCIQR